MKLLSLVKKLSGKIFKLGGGPSEETLWVNAFDETWVEWVENGDSPYLHETDTDYIYVGNSNATQGYFGFEDIGGSGSITITEFELHIKWRQHNSGTRKLQLWLNNGTEDVYIGEFTIPVSGTGVWEEIDIIAHEAYFDTVEKLNAAKLKIYCSVAASYSVFVYQAKLVVTYS